MNTTAEDEPESGQEPKAQGYVPEFDQIDVHGDPEALPEDDGSSVGGEALEGIQWRVAESLLALRQQINALASGRSRESDGSIGDDDHLKKGFNNSDHNPHVLDGRLGVVTALDVTHDPRHCDGGRLAASLHASRDPRIKYIIWNRRIANSSPVGTSPAWEWRAYTGANPHNHHIHVSVKATKPLYDSKSHWTVTV